MSKKSLQFSFDINSNNFDLQRHHRWINYENDEKREVFELNRIREFQSKFLKILINVIDEKLTCDHLILLCKLINNDISINFYFMIDNDITNIDFIDNFFAHYHEFSRILLSNSRFLIVVDDRNFVSSNLIYVVDIFFMIQNYLETIVFFIIKLKHYFVILNMSWLKLHDFLIYWNRNVVFFSSFIIRNIVYDSLNSWLYSILINNSINSFHFLIRRTFWTRTWNSIKFLWQISTWLKLNDLVLSRSQFIVLK